MPRVRIVLLSVTLLSAVAGGALGYFMRLDLPDVGSLEGYRPAQMTRVLAADGSTMATFGSEKRIVLGYGEIPESFRHALVASEDSEFMTHVGIDVKGVLRALLSDLRQMRAAEGASTLTMQLAGTLFLDRSEKTLTRKIQEALLALEIERRYSKEEILRFYSNQVHMGHGLYGLEAAARFYFGKPARDLDVGESAVIVGLLPRPAGYSPVRDIELAQRRRNLVLRRMVIEGYLDEEERARIAAEPIVLAQREEVDYEGSYFVEATRRWLRTSYGKDELYEGGLLVRTTMDPRLQQLAEAAVDRGLRRLDKRRGFRPDAVRRIPDGEDPATYRLPGRGDTIEPRGVTDGVVVQVDDEEAVVRVGDRTGTLTRSEMRWTRRTRPADLFSPGDIVRVRVVDVPESGSLRLTLEQEPQAEAALVAIDPSTGEILAMVGGFDFRRSEFNRVTQARRQTGSAFKPFVLAAALERGWTLADTLVDEPTVFVGERFLEPYQPENFSRSYSGRMTLRTVVESSANIPTVKLLDRIGFDEVIGTARGLGIDSELRPYPSLALGAFEATLLELTSAYGAFAQQGLHVEPHWIAEVSDSRHHEIHRARPRVRDAVSPESAYLVNRALSGVIRHGTGRAALVLDRELAGKTGTTDDNTDAWFIGYSPRLVVGVWVGFDERRSLGEGETGSRAALPIWIDFMQHALADAPVETFPEPPGLAFVPVDRQTGRVAHGPECGEVITEVFRRGSEPIERCSDGLHTLLRLPYPFQRYPLDADDRLRIPRDELVALLGREEHVVLTEDATAIETLVDGEVVRLAVSILTERGIETDEVADEEIDEDSESWQGEDGREAVVVRLGDRRARR